MVCVLIVKLKFKDLNIMEKISLKIFKLNFKMYFNFIVFSDQYQVYYWVIWGYLGQCVIIIILNLIKQMICLGVLNFYYIIRGYKVKIRKFRFRFYLYRKL